MADNESNEFDEDDFSGAFTDDDFSSTDLFGEEISPDELQTDAESETGFDFEDQGDILSSDTDTETDDDTYSEGSSVYSSLSHKLQDGSLKKVAIPAVIGIFVLAIIIYGAIRLFSSDGDTASKPSTMSDTPAVPASPIKITSQPDEVEPEVTTKPDKASQEIELPPLQMQKAAKQLKQGAQELTKLQEGIGSLQANMQTAFEKNGSDVEKIQQDINDLQTQAVQNAQAIQSLAKQLSTITNKVEAVSTSLDKMVSTIKKATEIETQQQQQAVSRGSQPPSMQQVGGPPAQMPPAYYVQAIIPGRAWLKDASGKVISVSVGDISS